MVADKKTRPAVTNRAKPARSRPKAAAFAGDSGKVRPRFEVKLRQVNRSGELLSTLRSRIARQEIPPGAKLREQEVAEEFDVPRTLIREVFSALEQRGLIERIPNRGALVTRLDMAQIVDLYNVREVLEGASVRLATEREDPATWQELMEYFDGPMGDYVAAYDFDAFIEGYERFRRRAADASGSQILAEMLDSIWEKTQVLIRRIIILPGRAQQGLTEHRAVLHAMRRGDAVLAEDLRRKNMRSAKETLLRYQNYLV